MGGEHTHILTVIVTARIFIKHIYSGWDSALGEMLVLHRDGPGKGEQRILALVLEKAGTKPPQARTERVRRWGCSLSIYL